MSDDMRSGGGGGAGDARRSLPSRRETAESASRQDFSAATEGHQGHPRSRRDPSPPVNDPNPPPPEHPQPRVRLHMSNPDEDDDDDVLIERLVVHRGGGGIDGGGRGHDRGQERSNPVASARREGLSRAEEGPRHQIDDGESPVNMGASGQSEKALSVSFLFPLL